MANDWLKINVNGQGWGTTGSGPSGTTPVTISASSCDETIARSATIVFRAGSLTKRLKVTQGIAASPKIQLVPDMMTIGVGQSSIVNLTVSNVDEITGWYWKVTKSSTNGVTVTGNLSGNTTSSQLVVRNNSATSGNFTLTAELYTADNRLLSSDVKSFVLTGDQNPDPVITIFYAGGTEMELRKNLSEHVIVSVSNIPNGATYQWTLAVGNSYKTGVSISPSGGSSNNVDVTLTNNSYSQGNTQLKAHVVVTYPNSDPKEADSQPINITFRGERFIYITSSQYTGDNAYGIPNALAVVTEGYISATVGVSVSDGDTWEIEGITSTTVSGQHVVGANSPVSMEKRILQDQGGYDREMLCLFNQNGNSQFINDQANSFIGKVVIRNHPEYYAMVSGTCEHKKITLIIDACWVPHTIEFGPEINIQSGITFNPSLADDPAKAMTCKYKIMCDAGYAYEEYFEITAENAAETNRNEWIFNAGTTASLKIKTKKNLTSAIYSTTLIARVIEGAYEFNEFDQSAQAMLIQKQNVDLLINPSAFTDEQQYHSEGPISWSGTTTAGEQPYFDVYSKYPYQIAFFPDPDYPYFITKITNLTTTESWNSTSPNTPLSGDASATTRYTMTFNNNLNDDRVGNVRVLVFDDTTPTGHSYNIVVKQKGISFYVAATDDYASPESYQTVQYTVGGAGRNVSYLVLTGDSVYYTVEYSDPSSDWFSWDEDDFSSKRVGVLSSQDQPITIEFSIAPNGTSVARQTEIVVSGFSESIGQGFIEAKRIVVRQNAKPDIYIYHRFANGPSGAPISIDNDGIQKGLKSISFDVFGWRVNRIMQGTDDITSQGTPESLMLSWKLSFFQPEDGRTYTPLDEIELGDVGSLYQPPYPTILDFPGDGISYLDLSGYQNLRRFVEEQGNGKLMITLTPHTDSNQILNGNYNFYNAEAGDYYLFGQYYGFIWRNNMWEAQNSGNPMDGEFPA